MCLTGKRTCCTPRLASLIASAVEQAAKADVISAFVGLSSQLVGGRGHASPASSWATKVPACGQDEKDIATVAGLHEVGADATQNLYSNKPSGCRSRNAVRVRPSETTSSGGMESAGDRLIWPSTPAFTKSIYRMLSAVQLSSDFRCLAALAVAFGAPLSVLVEGVSLHE